ncbi:MAG TPA: adenylate/guanylate cyclase domain-containing protein [Myxococcota bacterium]|nr:adenylate/guanylate cyclase domain-containing protein [Myxococcota bacterium]
MARYSSWLRARPIAGLIIAAIVSLAVVEARGVGLLMPLELGVQDELLRLRPHRALDRVALIRIREEDIGRFGHPLPDATLAQAIEQILSSGPRAVGIDLYRDQPVGSGAEQLATVLRSDPRVVVVEQLPDRDRPGTPPPSYLQGSERVGFTDFPLDPDGVVRRSFLFLWDNQGAMHVSFALRLALLYLRGQNISLAAEDPSGEALRLGAAQLAPFRAGDGVYVNTDDRGYQVLLDQLRGTLPFQAFSADDLLSGRLASDALRDKVVILGTTAPSVKDSFLTPFLTEAAGRRRAYGIDLHGRAVDQLLRRALDGDPPVCAPRQPIQAAAVVTLSLLGTVLGLWARSIRLVWILGLAVLALLLTAGWVALGRALWLPILPPGIGFAASTGLAVAHVLGEERREKALLRDIFSRHVGKDVLEELWRKRDQFMEGGRLRTQRMEISVLMADLQGYAEVSEKMEPGDLLQWVNEFMSTMARVVETSGGVVDDYWGDGLKANFSVPVPRTTDEEVRTDARNAVSCALAMAGQMERLNAEWRERGLPTGRLRVGIHTGPVVVGDIGSPERLKYTSVGDTVNVAARLESMDREAFLAEVGVAARIFVSEATRRHLGEETTLEPLGSRSVAGRSAPVGVFRVRITLKET